MQDKEKIVDRFTRARYAAWAGDVNHCQQLLNEIQTESSQLSEQNKASTFGLMLRAAAQLSYRLEIEQKKYDARQETPDHERPIISSKHLRAVVHRASEFEFELRAYLDDLSWEDLLYKRASATAAEAKMALARLEAPTLEQHTESLDDQESLRRPHTSWRIVGQNLVCVVSVGPFCLIKMRGTWTGLLGPRHIDEVIQTFQIVLDQIDPDEQPANRLIPERAGT